MDAGERDGLTTEEREELRRLRRENAGAARGAGHPEAGGDFLRDGDPMSRYRFVEAERSRYPVTQLCRIAQVSRAAYYEWQDGQRVAARRRRTRR